MSEAKGVRERVKKLIGDWSGENEALSKKYSKEPWEKFKEDFTNALFAELRAMVPGEKEAHVKLDSCACKLCVNYGFNEYRNETLRLFGGKQ